MLALRAPTTYINSENQCNPTNIQDSHQFPIPKWCTKRTTSNGFTKSEFSKRYKTMFWWHRSYRDCTTTKLWWTPCSQTMGWRTSSFQYALILRFGEHNVHQTSVWLSLISNMKNLGLETQWSLNLGLVIIEFSICRKHMTWWSQCSLNLCLASIYSKYDIKTLVWWTPGSPNLGLLSISAQYAETCAKHKDNLK